MKFKEGDKVRVKNNVPKEYKAWVGKEGVVEGVKQGMPCPYSVNVDGKVLIFFARELETINENPKI